MLARNPSTNSSSLRIWAKTCWVCDETAQLYPRAFQADERAALREWTHPILSPLAPKSLENPNTVWHLLAAHSEGSPETRSRRLTNTS